MPLKRKKMSPNFLFDDMAEDAANSEQVEAKKLSRRSDPETSQAAARKILAAANSEVQRYIDVVYLLYRNGNGPTAGECADYLYPDASEAGFYRHCQNANRRLSDAKNLGHIEHVPDGKRPCTAKPGDSVCSTWRPKQ